MRGVGKSWRTNWLCLVAPLLIFAMTGNQAHAQKSSAQVSLAQRLAAGAPYVIVTRRNLFPLPSDGREFWFTISGYYIPEKGTWTSSAVGFPTPGTPWHSCPAETICGGIHENGKKLDRWYRPEKFEMVAIGQPLTFDADGRLFFQGKQIGIVITPDFPID